MVRVRDWVMVMVIVNTSTLTLGRNPSYFIVETNRQAYPVKKTRPELEVAADLSSRLSLWTEIRVLLIIYNYC